MAEREKRGVEFEGTVPLETVLTYLDDLRERLSSGEVQVENGSASVLLVPSSSIRLHVRAREKDDAQSLRFEMEWERAADAPVPQALAFKAPNGESGKPARGAKKRS